MAIELFFLVDVVRERSQCIIKGREPNTVASNLILTHYQSHRKAHWIRVRSRTAFSLVPFTFCVLNVNRYCFFCLTNGYGPAETVFLLHLLLKKRRKWRVTENFTVEHRSETWFF